MHDVKLDAGQRAWYAEKKRTQGDDMTREYPSYPEEAFLASVEGQYYASEMRKLRERGRITLVLADANCMAGKTQGHQKGIKTPLNTG